MNNPVLNIADARSFPNQPEGSTKFGSVMAPMGKAIGAEKLGCMYMQVEPGKRAFPFHNHHANEEMFVILEGTGTYRLGDQEYAIKAGDICAAPTGGKDTAHQIINTGEVTLRYLSLSTKQDPDICEYPDSDKYAAFALGKNMDIQNAMIKVIGREKDTLNYFDGEEM